MYLSVHHYHITRLGYVLGFLPKTFMSYSYLCPCEELKNCACLEGDKTSRLNIVLITSRLNIVLIASYIIVYVLTCIQLGHTTVYEYLMYVLAMLHVMIASNHVVLPSSSLHGWLLLFYLQHVQDRIVGKSAIFTPHADTSIIGAVLGQRCELGQCKHGLFVSSSSSSFCFSVPTDNDNPFSVVRKPHAEP